MNMTKYLSYIVNLLLACFFIVSCTNDDLIIKDKEQKTILLTISSPELTTSRVVSRSIAGEDAYNENYIKDVYCFFYKASDGDDDSATYFTAESITINENYEGTPIQVPVTIPSDQYNTLFPTENTPQSCKVYILANMPEGIDVDANGISINGLKLLEVTASSFAVDEVTERNNNNSSYEFPKQESFVMDGESTLAFNENGQLSGNVPLYRAASKIALNITSLTPITDDNGSALWTPIPSQMRVELHNGIANGYVDGNGTTYPGTLTKLGKNTRNYIGTTPEGSSDVTVSYTHAPFYSYPIDWSSVDGNEVYLTLVVPWYKGSDTQDVEDYYYQIPVNYNGKKLNRNNYYLINLEVGVLGSLNNGDPLVLAPSSYVIVDWGTGGVSASFETFSYLIVDMKTVIYNQNSVTIPFVSSHEAEITDVKITQQKLATADSYRSNTSNDDDDIDNDENQYSITCQNNTDNKGGTITYTKNLVNDFTSDSFDFTPYNITFTLKHTDTSGSTLVQKNVTIIQYPAIYGERDVNSDSSNGGDTNGNNGYVWVNGYQSTLYASGWGDEYRPSTGLEDQDTFDNAQGLISGDVSSDVMMVFTVTSTKGTGYVIGDPRETSVNESFIDEKHNGDYSIWAYAPYISNGNVVSSSERILQNYYATETNSDYLKNATDNNRVVLDNDDPFYTSTDVAAQNERTYNMIAPKFRISSGYGQISTNGDRQYYHLMKKRCASYQEDGYPAGRWRLPTKAEIEFIFYLSDKGSIPRLFDDDMYYWCAHGCAKPISSGTNKGKADMKFITDYDSSNPSVRCVYDDWYWGSERALSDDQKGTFTWGDQPRWEAQQ